MPEVDLASYLDLAPDERVVWQGRAAVGARWPSWPRLVTVAVLLWAALVGVAAWDLQATFRGAALEARLRAVAQLLLVAPAGLLVLVGGSKLVGPSYRALTLVSFSGSLFAGSWVTAVQRHGVEGAIARLDGSTALLALVFVGLPTAWLVERLTWRLGTVYIVTTRQVAAFFLRDGGRAWRLWSEPLWLRGSLRARLERSWRCPEGWLVVGERELDLRGEEAERALDEVRAARPPAEG